MKRVIVIFFGIVLFSCNKPDPSLSVFHAESEILIAGFENAPIEINRSQKNEIENLEELEKSGLSFFFNEQGVLQHMNIKNTDYVLATKIGIGSSKEDVFKQYGKPLRDNLPIMKGERQIGLIDVLIYENVTFLVDSNDIVSNISIGVIDEYF